MPTTDNPNLIDDESLGKIRDVVLNKANKLAPAHITEINAEITKGKKSNNYSIKFEVDIDRFPDARAQEYGSGERATRKFKSPKQLGVQKRYKIEGKPFLAFEWDVADKETLHWSRIAHWNKRKKGEAEGLPSYAGEASDGKLLFNWVLHPGIHPANGGRGYLRPALADSTDEIVEIVGKSAVDNLKIKTRQIFSKVGKK